MQKQQERERHRQVYQDQLRQDELEAGKKAKIEAEKKSQARS